MATPHVAGCAALYVAHCEAKGLPVVPADFAKLVAATSKDLPPAGRDTASGFGLIQPAKLLPVTPDPMPAPKDPPETDAIVITPDPAVPITVGGRRVKRILLELEPPVPKP